MVLLLIRLRARIHRGGAIAQHAIEMHLLSRR
jgi:hypothetical protein